MYFENSLHDLILNQIHFISKNSNRSCHSKWEDHHDLLNKRKATQEQVKHLPCFNSQLQKCIFFFNYSNFTICSYNSFFFFPSFFYHIYSSSLTLFFFSFCLISLLICKRSCRRHEQEKKFLFSIIPSNWLRRFLYCFDRSCIRGTLNSLDSTRSCSHHLRM